jgi:hypothetical protein
MDRRLWVEVDQTTWPIPPAVPLFPAAFPPGGRNFNINILELLLTIGFLTTPIDPGGVSLSEFWAWVRYFPAISADPDLRLTKPFADLDAHQKTILSDDFGMGVPMFWLSDRLKFRPPCDGRYFIDRMKASIGATAATRARRGPGKSPDFVAQDSAGMWHVIECKGTQSASDYRRRQLGNKGPPPSGAVAQKRTITFPNWNTGQRLACGLKIGVHGGSEPSSLRVIDPAGAEQLQVGEDQLAFAQDTITRGTYARSLRLAGFEAASKAMSAPSGPFPYSRRTRGKTEEIRRDIVRQKRDLAADELKARATKTRFDYGGERYRGRQINLDLPVPVNLDGRGIKSVRVRQGVNARFLGALVQRPLVEDPIQDADIPWRQMIGTIKTQSDRFTARLLIGSLFTSEIYLQR